MVQAFILLLTLIYNQFSVDMINQQMVSKRAIQGISSICTSWILDTQRIASTNTFSNEFNLHVHITYELSRFVIGDT